jgi:peptidoglycan-associated lipoprotein
MKTLHGLALGAATLFGCAHAPPPATAETHETASATAPAPKPASAPVTAAPTPEEDANSLLRGEVLNFGFDEAQLMAVSEQRLQRLSEVLRAHPELKLAVAGNCDELGTEEYNLELGQKRAAAAQKYLAHLGIDPSRVSTVSYGKEHPVNPGHDEQARAQNRRDDLSLQRQ